MKKLRLKKDTIRTLLVSATQEDQKFSTSCPSCKCRDELFHTEPVFPRDQARA